VSFSQFYSLSLSLCMCVGFLSVVLYLTCSRTVRRSRGHRRAQIAISPDWSGTAWDSYHADRDNGGPSSYTIDYDSTDEMPDAPEDDAEARPILSSSPIRVPRSRSPRYEGSPATTLTSLPLSHSLRYPDPSSTTPTSSAKPLSRPAGTATV
jgi:hypothetical protein